MDEICLRTQIATDPEESLQLRCTPNLQREPSSPMLHVRTAGLVSGEATIVPASGGWTRTGIIMI